MAKRPHWIYVDRQYQLLELVAASISRFWDYWLKHLEENEENRSWTTLVKELSRLNHNVKEELNASSLNEGKLYKDMLSLARQVIRGADVLDLRLRDEQKNELYFASTLGAGWDKARLSKRFPIVAAPPQAVLRGLTV